jgi:hydroxymethylbilane synthase
MMKRHIVVGSRQSALALTQTNQVIARLEQIGKSEGWELEFSVKKIVTQGDRILDVTLSKVGGKGLFVKEIEQALIDGEIDLAVHSMKDVPSKLPEELIIGATPKRVDPRDALISKGDVTLDELPQGALVGTSSLRRSCQLKAYRPDLRLESIRGNIDTRLRKLETEGFDAILLAGAGLQRIGWEDRVSEYLSTELCVPAVGQGALGIECRANDSQIRDLLDRLNDPETEITVTAERAFLARLNGGCQVPIGAYATWHKDASIGEIQITGIVGSPEGDIMLKETMSGNEPEQLGKRLAEQLIERGADRILAQIGE